MCCDWPFDQLHHDEVAAVAAVEEQQAVGAGGLELEEQVHGCIRLQRGQRQVTALVAEGHGVGDDVAHAEAGVQLAVRDVSVLTLVQVRHTVQRQALQVPDEVRRHHRDEPALRHDARLDVV